MLTAAEAAVEDLGRKQGAELDVLRRKQDELTKERQALERQHERDTAKLETAVEKARQRYQAALEKWRE